MIDKKFGLLGTLINHDQVAIHKDLAQRISQLGNDFEQTGLTVGIIITKLESNQLYFSLNETEKTALAQFIITFCDLARKSKLGTRNKEFDDDPKTDPYNLLYSVAEENINSYLIYLAEYALFEQGYYTQQTTRDTMYYYWLTDKYEGNEPLINLLMIKLVFDLKEPWELE